MGSNEKLREIVEALRTLDLTGDVLFERILGELGLFGKPFDGKRREHARSHLNFVDILLEALGPKVSPAFDGGITSSKKGN